MPHAVVRVMLGRGSCPTCHAPAVGSCRGSAGWGKSALPFHCPFIGAFHTQGGGGLTGGNGTPHGSTSLDTQVCTCGQMHQWPQSANSGQTQQCVCGGWIESKSNVIREKADRQVRKAHTRRQLHTQHNHQQTVVRYGRIPPQKALF